MVQVPSLRWYENERRRLDFPESWDVEYLDSPGFVKPPLTEDAVARAIESPIGSPTISELAASASEVAIVFDDITRPTPVHTMLPPVLSTLEDAGIGPSQVRLIPALGMHGAMNNIDFRKKLGDDVVRKYPIFNHNPYENLENLGESPSGIPVHLNREFMACDLKIGVGCITPHLNVGFGGGGKIVLPGLAGVDTIEAFHSEVLMRNPQSIGLGRFEGNVMYEEVVRVVKMSGMQFKIDALLNERGAVTDVFAGDPVEEHLAGVEVAKEHYATSVSPGKDIVVVNAYAKYNEMGICMIMALSTVKPDGGSVVLLVEAPEGQVCHYLIRSFGKDYGGRCYIHRGAPPENLKVTVCTSYPDLTMCDLFSSAEGVNITENWDQTVEMLLRDHPEGASVAVIPDGTMQYFAS